MNLSYPMLKGLIFFIAVLFSLSESGVIFPQEVREFDFNKEWTWDELTEHVVLIDPSLLMSVDELKKSLSITDMRMILKELSELSSLADLRNLGITAKSDTEIDFSEKEYWDSVFTRTFVNYPETTNISNLLKAVTLLSKIRKSNLQNDKFNFEERSYLYQPMKSLSKKINIDFDYSGAEAVLDCFVNKTEPVKAAECKVYSDLLVKKLPSEFSPIKFIELLKEASYDITANNIYKWVNPQCYRDFGGVYIYKNKFRELLNSIKSYESNIMSDVDKNISKYLDDSIRINAKVLFIFGNFQNDAGRTNNNIFLPVENFGDNYEYLVKFIMHNTVKIADREIQIRVFEYVPDYKDRLLMNLMGKIMDNGIANYIGAVGTETRPWNLLEKDFSLFNKTYSAIKNDESKIEINSLINTGFSGNAPFYTMSTQMAYIIETTLGRSSLKEAIKTGPVSFFSKYIKAYKEYPDEIRKVFRFSSSLEKKINSFKIMFPEEEIKFALRIRNSVKGNDEKLLQIKNFVNSGKSTLLKNFLAGQILLESGMYEESEKYFREGINLKTDKSVVCGLIGKSFENAGADNIAMNFYELNIEYNETDADAYEQRGNLYYRNGYSDKALNDYITALKLNPGNSKLKEYIKIIETKEK
ncbi:MAG: hypothetical protein HGGPFJEG_03162 [Ignavibacteria bacterium]|nr:hypothetical protein [Ignavibacteria bacterium]